jgi:hypothetical protein
MQFDTKIAVVIRTDLEAWQKLNVASFLAGGIAAAFPECIGEITPTHPVRNISR